MPRLEGAAQARADTAADPTLLHRSLERLSGARVELRETHCSVVFLTSTRAYKLKKPVVFDFIDQRSGAARATACHRELELNETLAPGLGLAVRAVVAAPDGYVLSNAQDPGAVDHVVEMRRFDEASTMRALLERGALTPVLASAAGAAIGRFHRTAQVLDAPLDHRAVVHRNLEALLPLVAGQVPDHGLLGLRRFCDAFLLGWREVLEARVQQGQVVDGHGDLRAEHVLFEGDRVLVIDRLESDELRRVDVADDLAFLLMDLESRQGAAFATAVHHGYVRGGGAPHPAALLAYFGAYRAQVRAKVALLRASQLPAEDADADAGARLLGLSRRLSWRARGPLVLLVTGPPASGKSTLAAELGRVSGLTVLASDDARKEGGDAALGYAMAERAEVYRRLAGRALHHAAVIVDATFGEPDLQRAFLDALGTARPLLAVECVAPTEVRTARAAARRRFGGSPSDAGPTVARTLGDRFQPMAAVAGARLAVDTQAALDLQVDAVEAWLDARLARGIGLPTTTTCSPPPTPTSS